MRARSTWRVVAAERKTIILRLDPAVHDALAQWARAVVVLGC
jgi:hypothetical protein